MNTKKAVMFSNIRSGYTIKLKMCKFSVFQGISAIMIILTTWQHTADGIISYPCTQLADSALGWCIGPFCWRSLVPLFIVRYIYICTYTSKYKFNVQRKKLKEHQTITFTYLDLVRIRDLWSLTNSFPSGHLLLEAPTQMLWQRWNK